jgi:hypothetical protein
MKIPDAKINRLHYNVKKHFRAYFRELRKQIAMHDPDFQTLPHWFRGGREVETIVCKDGAVVVHWPYDVETMTFPDSPDSYPLLRSTDELVKERVAMYDHPWPDPTALPNNFAPIVPDYSPPGNFSPGYWPEPRRRATPWDSEGQEIVYEDKWTRLDYAPVDKWDNCWGDERAALNQARAVLNLHLEDS